MARVYGISHKAVDVLALSTSYYNEDGVKLTMKAEPQKADDNNVTINHTSDSTINDRQFIDHSDISKNCSNHERQSEFNLQKNFAISTERIEKFASVTIKKEEILSPEKVNVGDVRDTRGEGSFASVTTNSQVNDTSPEKVSIINNGVKRKRREVELPRKRSKRRLRCKTCFLPFSNELTLARHENVYGNYRNIVCQTCYGRFSSRYALNSHNRKCHTIEGYHKNLSSYYICHFCTQGFSTKKIMQRHLFHIHDMNSAFKIKDSFVSPSCEQDTAEHMSSSLSVTDNPSQSSPTKKRQTTLTEFFKISPEKSVIKADSPYNVSAVGSSVMKSENNSQSPIIMTETNSSVDGSTSDVRQETDKENINATNNKPFVKIHVNSNVMETLLSIHNASEKSDSSNSTKSYNLRARRSLNFQSPSSSPGDRVQENVITKTCTIPLVRCDQQRYPFRFSPRLAPNFHVKITKQMRSKSKTSQSVRKSNNARTFQRNSSQTVSKPSNSKKRSTVRSEPKLSKTCARAANEKSVVQNGTNDSENHSEVKTQAAAKHAFSSVQQSHPESSETNGKKVQQTNTKNESTSKKEAKNKKMVSLYKSPIVRSTESSPKSGEKSRLKSRQLLPCKVCRTSFFSKQKKLKHVKLFHTAYMSSICQSRYSSKRRLLHHYLSQHCIFNMNNCCVCDAPCSTRHELKKHLFLHCIKIVQSPGDRFELNSVQCESVWSAEKKHKKKFSLKLLLRKHISSDKKPRERSLSLSSSSSSRKENTDQSPETTSKSDINATNEEEKRSNALPTANTVDSSNIDSSASSLIPPGNCTPPKETSSKIEQELLSLPSLNAKEDLLAPTQELKSSSKSKDVSLTVEEEAVRQHVDPVAPSASQTEASKADDNVHIVDIESVPEESSNAIEVFKFLYSNLKQKYSCSVCGMRFQKLENFRQHMRTFVQLSENYCGSCGIAFSTNRLLKKHVITAHQPEISRTFILHCKFCNQGFDKEKNLRVHELHYHHNQTIIDSTQSVNCEQIQVPNTKCNVCSLMFDTHERFMEHSIYYYKKHIFKCSFCCETFEGMYMLNHHQKLVHYRGNGRKYNYICGICDEGFNSESHFHAHRLHMHINCQSEVEVFDNTAKKCYICRLCKISFSSSDKLLAHMEYYTNDGKFQCRKCYRKCLTADILEEHVNLNHVDTSRDGIYKCDVCGDIVKSAISLFSHQKHFHFDDQFSCESYPVSMLE